MTVNVEECVTCPTVNEHGGPGHFNQSDHCQYRPWVRFHCTCDACY